MTMKKICCSIKGMEGKLKGHYFAFSLVVCLMACSSKPTNVSKMDIWPDIYPDYVGVTIPVGLAPLDFAMADEDVTTIDVEVKGSKGGSLHANGTYADFDIDDWHQLLEQNKGGVLTFTVCAEKNGQWTGYKDFTVNVSADPLEEWGVTYRRIPPSYELYSQMGLYQRDLGTFEETELMQSTRVDANCVNCHTTNRTNPDQYVFHVRGEHGATVLSGEVLQAKNDTLGGSMVYKTSQMFHSNMKNKRIEVYDSSSDVFVYDTQTHTILRDTLIMKTLWAENTPAFSPDGKWLYFTTAKRQLYPTDYDKEMYSLCRVSFDEQTGRIGEQVDTLVNTLETGKSVSWPRPSYDGRYLMYTQTDYGYFSIWHPEADLWLLDLQTGESRAIDEVNSALSDSFHNWSSNSSWFLFTSRGEDGLYTRLYFSHFDKKTGKATKPFLLPQRDPRRYYQLLMYSYNTPDFASRALDIHAKETGDRLLRQDRVATQTNVSFFSYLCSGIN